jgi:hypothetical protein
LNLDAEKRISMEKIDALEAVLTDPTRSERDKTIARAALDRAQANVTDAAVSELLLQLNKPLTQTGYHEIYAFCGAQGWPKARPLYDLWLNAYFTTECGRKDAERIAEYLRDHDINEMGYALEQWKDSGWKASGRLIDVLERIAANRGTVHTTEAVEQAQQFLTELKRRASQ